jgi:NAD(P)H dehydrogenase (quinone)
MRPPGIILTLLCATALAGPGCRLESGGGGPPQQGSSAATVVSSGDGPTKILVGFYSLSGNTEKMATAVTEGARQVPGVTVTQKPVADITQSDLQSAHGIVLGCPTHFANIPGEMKTIIDHWALKLGVNFTNKVGGAFSTGGNFTGGKEHVVISLLLYMLNNRMIVAGPIYKPGDRGWGEIGASATTGRDDPGLRDAELSDARKLGQRIANVARSLTQ